MSSNVEAGLTLDDSKIGILRHADRMKAISIECLEAVLNELNKFPGDDARTKAVGVEAALAWLRNLTV